MYGNPLWPAVVKFGGHVIFQGWYDTSVFARYGLTKASIWKMLVDDHAQFGVRLPLSALLWAGFFAANALCVVAWLRQRTRISNCELRIAESKELPVSHRDAQGTKRNSSQVATRTSKSPVGRVLAVCLIFPVSAGVLYFLFTPFWREHRLLYPVYYSLWLAGAYACSIPLGRMGRVLRPWLAVALVVALLLFLYVFWFMRDTAFVAVAVVCAVVAMLPWRRRRFARRAKYVLVGGLVVAALAGPWWYPEYRTARLMVRPRVYVQAYDDRGWGWNLVDSLTAGNPMHVAYTGTPIIFPLFGPFLENRVTYVPISSDDHPGPTPLRADVLSPRLDEPSPGLQLARYRRRRMDAEYWLKGLSNAAIDVLYLEDDPDMGGAAQELGVIQNNPQRFELLMRRDGPQRSVYVFRVLKGAVATTTAANR